MVNPFILLATDAMTRIILGIHTLLLGTGGRGCGGPGIRTITATGCRKRRYGKNAIQNFFHNNFPSLNEWRFTQKHFGRDRVYTTKACELRRGELEMGF